MSTQTTDSPPIPFNRTAVLGNELAYIREAIDLGHISGDGTFTKRANALLEKAVGAKKALLTTSCTDALEMCALLLNVKQGDEVIVPAYTFPSTINAFALHGAAPAFVDVRPDTLNIDENLISARITAKTKAIVVVHYGGVGCEMDAIQKIADAHNLPVIEDNAHGLFGKYRGRALGSMGALATQSFHETKNIACGEGGALLINDTRFSERAEILREKGTNRSRFLRGQVDKYSWVDIGSSFLPSDLLAAFLVAQLEQAEKIQARRKQIWSNYAQGLKAWAGAQGVGMPNVPSHCEQAYHLFYMVCPTLNWRQALIAHLKQHRISAVFHYQPLHLSDMGRNYGGKPGQCPVTEQMGDRLLRLPFFYDLDEKSQARVIQVITEFKGQ